MRLAALLVLALAQPAMAQTLGQGASTDVPWLRVIGALILCLSLAVGGAYALRSRLGGGAPPAGLKRWREALGLTEAAPRRLQLIETVRLSHQIDICLLRYDGKDLLIAASSQGAQVLGGGEPEPEQ